MFSQMSFHCDGIIIFKKYKNEGFLSIYCCSSWSWSLDAPTRKKLTAVRYNRSERIELIIRMFSFFHDDPAVASFWNDVVPNYDDNQLYCGGLGPQIGNDYKCGVCGDNYADARPRANELGGKYGSSGIIPRTYSTGGIMNVEVQITTHHQGNTVILFELSN